MSFEKFLFYLFAAILIFAAGMVITRRNPVHSVLYLVLAFFNAAGLWLLAEAEFLAITLVLVYVGAVMVLFLFVVMMLDINTARLKEGFIHYLPIGIGVGIILVVMLVYVVGPTNFGHGEWTEMKRHAADYSNTQELGRVLYTVYVYPFEIAAVILLVAIVAAIALTLRKRPATKYQNPDSQISVKREDRVRVVKMKSDDRK